jgi:serine/threonine-protein kinase
VLYEMVTGRPPFPGENAAAGAIADAVPVAPRRIDPAIPETLEAIVLKTLAKNPANRYPSAHDMRGDLRRYREGARIAAQPAAAPPVPPAPLADPDATVIMSGVDHAAPTETMKRTSVLPAPRPDLAADDRGDDDEDEDEDEAPPRPYAVLVVLVVLTLVMVGLLFLVTRSSGGDDTGPATTASGVTVPRVVDMRQGDAEAALQAANLVPEVVTATHDTVAIGIVIEQSPAANENVESGSKVTVTVSSGAATIAIPDLTGKTRDEAMQALTDLAFVPSPTEVESATVAEGLVVGTNPPAGTAAARGATVEIQVSAGSNTTAVPDVTSQPEAQARATLEGAGFAVTTTPQPSDTVAPGLVIGTNPAAGTMAPNGSTITVMVSGGFGGGGGGGQVGVVPDVVGQDEDDARRQLEEAGFVVTTTEEPTDRRRWDGRVLSQSLPGGTPSPPGSVITIVIGRSEDFDFG